MEYEPEEINIPGLPGGAVTILAVGDLSLELLVGLLQCNILLFITSPYNIFLPCAYFAGQNILEESNAEISGRRVWPGSALLAQALCDPHIIPDVNLDGATVLELGAGSGLVGIIAARLGAAHVTITDGDQTSVDLMKQNVTANGFTDVKGSSIGDVKIHVEHMLWGENSRQEDIEGMASLPPPSMTTTQSKFSVVLAADVLYKKSLPPLFFHTLKKRLLPDGRGVLCHLVRAGVTQELVVKAAKEAGFVVTQVPHSSSKFSNTHCSPEEAALAQLYVLKHDFCGGAGSDPPEPPRDEEALAATATIGATNSTASTVASAEASWLTEVHISYVLSLREKTHTFEHVATEHLRMSGVYWGLTAMALMGRDGDMHRKSPKIDAAKLSSATTGELVEWVMQCQQPNGGFGGNIGHDAHILYTLSAVQILAICDALDRLEIDLVAQYFAGLQQADGSFVGDEWGEVDTRFSYCALSGLSILGRLESVDEDGKALIDLEAATQFVASCKNFDGGFGCIPGAESHAGQVFCCVAALSIGGALHLIDHELLGWWLAERQCDSGGLNGRPEKQADVCYSWWILSALSILGKVNWIDTARLSNFILECQVRIRLPCRPGK